LPNITKTDLANRVSKRLGKSAIDMKLVIEEFLDEIMVVLADGDRIEIRGFGAFKTKTRAARIGRNPRSGEKVPVPSYIAPIFKFSKDAQKIFEEKMDQRQEAALQSAMNSKRHKRGKNSS
jgi:nucleoid DNA-binding protein